MSRQAPQPELDAEREVDLGRAAGVIAQRWWLPLVGLVVGLVIGWAMAVGSTQVYRASALLYTGFPLAVGGGPLPGVNSAPATVRQLVQSDEVVQRVATVSGLRPGQVRGGTSLSTPSGGRGVQAQTLTITVRGPARRRVRLAANELARIVSNRLGRFVDGKISNYERQVSSQQAALDALGRSIDETTRALRSRQLDPTQRLILLSTLSTSEARRAALESEALSTRQLLVQAREYEKPAILARAVPREVTARSKRSSLVVAGALGLLAGIIAALAWDPVAARLRRT